MRSRTTLLVVIVLVIAAGAIGAWSVLADDASDDALLVEMIEFASQSPQAAEPDDDFPAIIDSAIRDPDEREAPSIATFAVLEIVDHDTSAFTQGFELDGDRLFESTGLVGSSTLREVEPDTGQVVRSIDVPDVFAEGLTVVGDEIVQITWTEGVAFRYEADTFDLIETHTYEGEGWGICHDGQRLVMSDGTPELSFRDPASFALIGSVPVTYNGAPVERINELECVGGKVWANIWQTPLIIEIDPTTGVVTTVITAAELRPVSTTGNSGSVLNGIAYDPATDSWLLTGKRWPFMYRVEFATPA